MKNKTILIITIIILCSCNKYLDKKPDKKLVVPTTLQDIQSLLDHNDLMNRSGSLLGEASADNYYLKKETYNALASITDKELYIWGNNITQETSNEWSKLYNVIYNANVCLETVNKIKKTKKNKSKWENTKGSALFYRAYSLQQIVFTWSEAYDSLTAKKTLGIPLKLSSNFNKKSTRSTLYLSYKQIIDDLKKAIKLLPVKSTFPTRPSKAAAYGLLSRIYLSMGKYSAAAVNANFCIQISKRILDYNTIDLTKNYPIEPFNDEVIYYVAAQTPGTLVNSKAKIDSNLYASYTANDLRKALFFKINKDNTVSFRGSYKGSSGYFVGIALDEVYLTYAECLAREGNIEESMKTFGELIKKRYRHNSYTINTEIKKNNAIQLILEERRKELIFRDLRWMDIKRLNKNGSSISIERKIGQQLYKLKPNENKFALPIPREVISITGMKQNPR